MRQSRQPLAGSRFLFLFVMAIFSFGVISVLPLGNDAVMVAQDDPKMKLHENNQNPQVTVW